MYAKKIENITRKSQLKNAKTYVHIYVRIINAIYTRSPKSSSQTNRTFYKISLDVSYEGSNNTRITRFHATYKMLNEPEQISLPDD